LITAFCNIVVHVEWFAARRERLLFLNFAIVGVAGLQFLPIWAIGGCGDLWPLRDVQLRFSNGRTAHDGSLASFSS